MLNRRAFLTNAAIAAPALLLMSRPALASTPRVFAVDGLAIRGTDPVSYFTQGGPVAGSSTHEIVWGDATWRFASEENMERFMGDVHSHAPQFGGYCAFAMSRGEITTTDPHAWTIVDGKLYLNYSLPVRTVWSEDIAGNIALANGHWPNILR